MTTPPANAASNPSLPKGNAAMPEDNRPLVLQRGGEEINLEKLDDRFTVSVKSGGNVPAVAQRAAAQVSPGAPNQLTELQVEPGQRDQAMREVRRSGLVNYASHVYQMQDDPTSKLYLTNQITIQFGATITPAAIAQIATESGLRQVKPIAGVPNAYVFELTSTSTENPIKLTNRLVHRPEILLAEPNIVVPSQSHYRPTDSMYPKQWHLNHSGGFDLAAGSHIGAEQAWNVTRGSRAIVVAVMDDGMDLNHPDFQGMGKIVAPRDFKGRDFVPTPEDGNDNHGTACAGVAIAEENGVGCVGVAPGCALMPIRTTGFLDDQTIEDLFDWAVTKGAAVISCSWGPSAVYYPLSLRQKAALTQAATKGRDGKGCVILFAAGNANRPTNGPVIESGWPQNAISGETKWLGGFTAHPNVITVSACTSLNRKAAYSNWGAEVSICGPSNNAPPGVGLPNLGYIATPPEVTQDMPGLGIITTDRVGDAGYSASNYANDFGGTSSATPLVAGLAGLVLSANPNLTAQEVRQILEQTADKIVDRNPDQQFGLESGTYEVNGRCDWFGYGKVNAAKAVAAAVQKRAASMTRPRSVQSVNTQGLSIPDGSPQGIASSISIGDSGTVQDLQVSLDIDHGYLGDLEIRVVAPNGRSALLQGRTLGRRTKLQVVYTIATTPTLQRLLGGPSQGRWQLQIVDAVPQDAGTLNWWKLSLGI
jgi:subtilisin family serine protease